MTGLEGLDSFRLQDLLLHSHGLHGQLGLGKLRHIDAVHACGLKRTTPDRWERYDRWKKTKEATLVGTFEAEMAIEEASTVSSSLAVAVVRHERSS